MQEYCIFHDAAESQLKISQLERQCKEWERRTWEALDKLHIAIDQKIGARCAHGTWIADHCWECGKRSQSICSDEEERPETEEERRARVKALAHTLDPECWVSYSGKPKQFKQAMDIRRNAALAKARASSNTETDL